MEKRSIRSLTTKRMLTAAIAAAAIGGLVLGTVNVSAEGPRQRAGKALACLQQQYGAPLLEAKLDLLVENGTITAAQQTAIVDQVSTSMEAADRGCTGMDLVRDKAVGEAVTDLLGIERADIRIAWLDGQSLAEIADAQGIERQSLIDTITAAIDVKLADAVEEGKLTAERKAEIEAGLPAKIEKAIDLRLSDVVDAMKDARDGSDPSGTPAT